MRKLQLPGALISAAIIGVAVLVGATEPGRAFEAPSFSVINGSELTVVVEPLATRAARAGVCRIVSPNFKPAARLANSASNIVESLVAVSCVNPAADSRA